MVVGVRIGDAEAIRDHVEERHFGRLAHRVAVKIRDVEVRLVEAGRERLVERLMDKQAGLGDRARCDQAAIALRADPPVVITSSTITTS